MQNNQSADWLLGVIIFYVKRCQVLKSNKGFSNALRRRIVIARPVAS